MEFVKKPIFFRTSLNGIREQANFTSLNGIREQANFFRTSLNGIREQANFGPVLMEFVNKPISDQS